MNSLYQDLQSPYPANLAFLASKQTLWLADRGAITTDGKWYIRQIDGRWELCKSAKAARHLMMQWLGGPLAITRDDIDEFMKKNPPVVSGGMKVPPSKAVYVQALGHVWVNTWDANTVMQANGAALHDPALRLKLQTWFRMVREGTCGMAEPKTLDEMIAIANGREEAELAFRFTVHWLAAPLQEIGRNLQTNLWLVSELGGTGKTTIATTMSGIYGFDNYGQFNQDEAKQGGWNDCFANKLFINWNEVSQGDMRSGFDCNSFIKNNTTDETVSIRRRNHDSYSMLNFANTYFTGNRESCPWGALDHLDRRNAIFAGTEDPDKRELALQFQIFKKQDPDGYRQVLAAIAYVLQKMIEVDHKLLEFAPDTEIKREMQEAASPEIDGLYWCENDYSYPQDAWLPASEYATYYKRFMDQPNLPPRRFGSSILGKLARKCYIDRRKLYNTSRFEYRIPSKRFPRGGSMPADQTNNVVALIGKSAMDSD